MFWLANLPPNSLVQVRDASRCRKSTIRLNSLGQLSISRHVQRSFPTDSKSHSLNLIHPSAFSKVPKEFSGASDLPSDTLKVNILQSNCSRRCSRREEGRRCKTLLKEEGKQDY